MLLMYCSILFFLLLCKIHYSCVLYVPDIVVKNGNKKSNTGYLHDVKKKKKILE